MVNIMNPDAFIARKNIQRFNTTGKIDIYYLVNLSDDATPELISLLHNPNERLQKSTAHFLDYKKLSLNPKPRPWQSFNISRSRTQKLLHENARQLEMNENYEYKPDDDIE